MFYDISSSKKFDNFIKDKLKLKCLSKKRGLLISHILFAIDGILDYLRLYKFPGLLLIIPFISISTSIATNSDDAILN